VKVSKNFQDTEFACKGQAQGKICCDSEMKLNQELIEVVQDIRDYFASSVKITSSYRCPIHNKRVGSGDDSQHLLGTAADIQVKHVAPSRVARYLNNKYPDTYGLGAYNSFTHIDVRTRKARWDKTGK
jgi:uncharacterized protein YcbK (DUF882 family)